MGGVPNRMPPAEENLDPERVASLLSEQFPELASRRLIPFANGWDNTLLRLGDDLLVRLPRREAAAPLVAHEQRWLPELAARLPLPVPTPLYIGRPSSTYPWPWSITAYFPGVNAGEVQSLDTTEAARTLGAFLGSLHLPAPSDAPANPFRGVAIRLREEAFFSNLELAGADIDAHAAVNIWRSALEATVWQGAPLWLHGDLHPANLVVKDARISAVVDFGDITSGDPASDLAIAWMLLPLSDRAVFWSSYAASAVHRVDADLKLRARGWAVAFAAVFLARSADNPLMKDIGIRTAAAVLDAV
jgi:aminoglycoside phosphotransferase (APT) family kinase protein